MNFKILFFDLDNTLIDRDRAFSLWLQDFHFQVRGELMSDSMLSKLMAIDNHGMESRGELWQAVIDRFGLNLNPGDLQFKLNRELAKFVTEDEKVISMLARLKKFYDLQLVTDGSSINQRQKIKASGCESYFSAIYISEEMGKSKPLLFEQIKKKITCSPEECLMTGDNYEADILGAQKEGFKTCFLGEQKADINISRISELEDALCLLK